MSAAAVRAESAAARRARAWVERVVIGLSLCPFAADGIAGARLRVEVSGARDEATLLLDLGRELDRLAGCDASEIETTLLVHPDVLRDFADFNAFLDRAEALLEARGLVGVLQLASFHPDYRFAGAPANDAANYTNRSPDPMLHLLREQSVSRAVDGHPDPEGIPDRNIARLRALGTAELVFRLAACSDDAPLRSPGDRA